MFVILPYLDQRALFDKHRAAGTANKEVNETIELFLCPSTPPDRRGVAGNAYVANSGVLDGPPGQVSDFRANGVFHNRSTASSPDIRFVSVNTPYISDGDGLSNTLLLSENADAARWTGGPNGPTLAPTERWMGFTWHTADGQPGDPAQLDPQHSLGINVRTGESHRTQPQSAAPGYARPSSYHVDGVNVAFCDGRVRFIGQDISYGVYQALMTPRGSEAMYVGRDGTESSPLPADHAARQRVDEEQIQ
jgi:prepilin-type processing-associated H-X9-DG protein